MESCAAFSSAGVRSPTSTGRSQHFSLFGNRLGCIDQYMVAAKAELSHYQKLTLKYEKSTYVLAWLNEQEAACPNVIQVARCLF